MTTATVPPDQRELWDTWHEDHEHASHEEHAKDTRERFLDALPEQRPLRVLEIGCGQGRDAIELARAGLEVVALDRSSVGLARAREARPDGVDITWVEADYADGLPFPDASFDAVYSHLSLHYLDGKATRALFNDIARVVRPLGMLCFTVRAEGDELHGQGTELETGTLYCREGHVRRFFSVPYTQELLSDWRDVDVVSYGTSDRTINPGRFIRGRARRRLPEWTDVPDFFVWEAFDRASHDPARRLADDAAQQEALLAETDNFYVIPDQFGVVSGHVLVLPKASSSSIAGLDGQIDGEIVWLLRHVSDLISASSDANVVVAEHGECGCATAGQAHVHVLPVPATVTPRDLRAAVDRVLRRRMIGVERVIYRDLEFIALEDMQALHGAAGAEVVGHQIVCDDLTDHVRYPAGARTASGLRRPYVYFSGPGVEFLSTRDFGSQFVREVVAIATGLPDGTWDRRANPSRANMFATFARLAPWFGRSGETRCGFSPRSGSGSG